MSCNPNPNPIEVARVEARESVLSSLLSDEAVDRASRVLEANVSSPFTDCEPVARELLSALHSHLRGDGHDG